MNPVPLSRRSFLRAGVTTAIAACVGTRSSSALAGATRFPIGLQLYLVMDALNQDFDGTLARIAGIGYREVELPHFFGRSAQELDQSFKAAGLVCHSVHAPPRPFLPGMPALESAADAIIESCAALGAKYLVCPIPWVRDELTPKPEDVAHFADIVPKLFSQMTLDDWKRYADFLSPIAVKAKSAGLQVAHHTHNLDFRRIDGVTGFDELLRRTDPALVQIEADLGWVAAAGLDPVQFLREHVGRVPLAHLKDLTRDIPVNTELKMSSVEVGRGIIDWQPVLTEARNAGVRYGYVEQEPPYAKPTIESARLSFDYLGGISSP